MSKGVDIEKFEGLTIDIDFNKIIEDNSRRMAEQIKNKAKQVLSNKASNTYADSWTYRMERDVGVDKLKGVIFNQEHYQLTHLLENGHLVKNGSNNNAVLGRVSPRKHIKPVFDANVDVFVEEMSKAKFEIKEK